MTYYLGQDEPRTEDGKVDSAARQGCLQSHRGYALLARSLTWLVQGPRCRERVLSLVGLCSETRSMKKAAPFDTKQKIRDLRPGWSDNLLRVPV